MVKGILTQEEGRPFVLGAEGQRFFENEPVWRGYTLHWLGAHVCARELRQRDYRHDRPIILLWPDREPPPHPYVELYFNERLPKYLGSLFGHIAINVNGEVFNFSHLINENEGLKPEEYFYRPALGEFAPHPLSGGFDATDRRCPYYDKFGRRFMRTVYVVQITGVVTEGLTTTLQKELNRIHETPPHPNKPDSYRDFHFLARNCTTIIRDALRIWGFKKIRGIIPRELFSSATWHFLKIHSAGAKIRRFRLRQLKVPEAPYSRTVPVFNPLNRVREWRLAITESQTMETDAR